MNQREPSIDPADRVRKFLHTLHPAGPSQNRTMMPTPVTTDQDGSPDSEQTIDRYTPINLLIDEYVQSTYEVFEECPRIRRLKLLSVEVEGGFLLARFEGPLGDFRGPYGVIVRLPETQQDELREKHADGGERTVRDWLHSGVALRAIEAHAAAQNQVRGYTPDNTWWLINDSDDGTP